MQIQAISFPLPTKFHKQLQVNGKYHTELNV